MRQQFLAFLHVFSRPAVALGSAVVLAALIIGGTLYMTTVAPGGVYTRVTMAPITEAVDVSGPVQGAETTDLSFQIPGQVAAIPVSVGQRVYAGQTLVALAGGAQAAALLSARANLETASASLASLIAGTRAEQLAIDQNTVAQAQQALANATRSAYIAADTALHTNADQFFSNARTANPRLVIRVPNAALVDELQNERAALEPLFSTWSAAANASGDQATAAALSISNLSRVSAFLDHCAEALAETGSSATLPAATLAAYQSSIAAARTSVAGAASVLTGAQTALTNAQGALVLAQAGPTPQAIAVAEAQVHAAQAAVDAAQVSADESVITAPISGTITVQDAHLGQTVTPGVPLVSMIGTGSFEAKVPVSEGDIGKVKVGQSVIATFDAYPGVTFPATVTAVDPAATLANGIASYHVTATFTKNDSRIASGLTAHLSITTASVQAALVVPASAVITNGSQQFVYRKGAKGAVKTPVTTGIESLPAQAGAAGMVQILSGLSAGDQVLSFGVAQ